MVQGKKADAVGLVFGKLTVVGLAASGNKGRHRRWECRCECGNTTVVMWPNLAHGKVISCGCALVTAGKRRRRGEESALHGWWKNITSNEKKRGLSVTVTKEDAIKLGKQPCHYCGDSGQVTTYYAAQYRYQALREGCFDQEYYDSLKIQMNGLDRVDNSRGYEPDNVVPCCRRCNRAKNDETAEEFLSWARRLVEHQAK